MNLTLLELNELIYCVGTATKTGSMVNKKVAKKLYTKLTDELERRSNLLDMAENGPNCQYSGLPSPEAYKEPESMFHDIWTEDNDKQLLDEAGAVQRWG
jgi:hypothetical protein